MSAREETFAQTMPREMGYDYMGVSYPGEKGGNGHTALGHLHVSRPYLRMATGAPPDASLVVKLKNRDG